VKATTNVSVKAFTPMRGTPMQLDAAGNQWFSGTQMRQGQKAVPPKESLSAPKSKWVTGAGLNYPAKRKRKLRHAPVRSGQGKRSVVTVNRQKGCGKGTMDSFYLLTVPSNG